TRNAPAWESFVEEPRPARLAPALGETQLWATDPRAGNSLRLGCVLSRAPGRRNTAPLQSSQLDLASRASLHARECGTLVPRRDSGRNRLAAQSPGEQAGCCAGNSLRVSSAAVPAGKAPYRPSECARSACPADGQEHHEENATDEQRHAGHDLLRC